MSLKTAGTRFLAFCNFNEKYLFLFLCRLKPETLEKDLDKYSESARMQRGGRMGLPEFAEYLGVPVSDTLEDMFSLFDEVWPPQQNLQLFSVYSH